jgi:hypothetical protein
MPEKVSFLEHALSVIEERGRIDRKSMARGAVVMAAALIVGCAFVWSYVGGLHEPAFHKVSLAVAGPPALSQKLGSGDQFKVTQVASRHAAVDRIRDRRASGAVVAGPHGLDVLVATLAGAPIADALRADLAPELQAQAPRGTPVRVLDVKPAPRNDPAGLSPFFLALSLTISSYVGAVFFALAFGVKPVRVWWRLLGVAGIALALAIGEVAIVHAVGALHGHYLTLALSGLLLGLSVSVITVGLQSFLGVLGTAMAILLFVILGNPSSGGPVPTELLHGVWRTLGPYLPVGAATDLIRNVAYFDGHKVSRSLLVLFSWLSVGIVFVLASLRARPLGLQMKGDFDRQQAASVATADASQAPRRRAA